MMEIIILGTGSKGNCVLVQDVKGNQILLDCGIPYSDILRHINFLKLDFVLQTHEHKDHSLSFDKFKNLGIRMYSQENVTDKQHISNNNWEIIAIELQHNVKCFGYMIKSLAENKTLAYITDTTYIPVFRKLDCLILDINYSNNVINNLMFSGVQIKNLGFKNHNSIENTVAYFEYYRPIIKKLVAFHLSNSGHNRENLIIENLSQYPEELIIAKKDRKILI